MPAIIEFPTVVKEALEEFGPALDKKAAFSWNTIIAFLGDHTGAPLLCIKHATRLFSIVPTGLKYTDEQVSQR